MSASAEIRRRVAQARARDLDPPCVHFSIDAAEALADLLETLEAQGIIGYTEGAAS